MSKQRYTFRGAAESKDDEHNATDVEMRIRRAFDHVVRLLGVEVEMAEYADPREAFKALSRRVLIVVRPDSRGQWAAYIDAVPGINPEREKGDVAEQGTKLPKEVAVFFFPFFDPAKYRK